MIAAGSVCLFNDPLNRLMPLRKYYLLKPKFISIMRRSIQLLLSIVITTMLLIPDVYAQDPSAVLDLESTSKGVLIPRMSSAQRTMISMPSSGLLVFDTDTESFWFKNSSGWVELVDDSSSSDDQLLDLTMNTLSIEDGNSVDLSGYLDNTDGQMLGLSSDILSIDNGGSVDLSGYLDNTDDQELSLSGKDLSIEDGNTVLLPTDTASFIADSDFDTRVAAVESGNNDRIEFRVNGQERMRLSESDTRTQLQLFDAGNNVFIGKDMSGNAGNAADNVVIGRQCGQSLTSGDGNVFVGRLAGQQDTSGGYNTFVGSASGRFNKNGQFNTYIGNGAGSSNVTGNNNVAIGYQAGRDVTGGNNVSIGHQAGLNNTGSGNVFIGYQAGSQETGSQKLYIENSFFSEPLIYGDFANDEVKINGKFYVTSDLSADGDVNANGKVLQGGVTLLPVGTITMYYSTVPPQGWLLCDGQPFDTLVYPELYSFLQDTETPNFNGRFPLGVGNSGTTGSENHFLGFTGGQEEVQLQVSEMPQHNHGAGSLSVSTNEPYLTKENLGGDHARRDGSDVKLWETSSASISGTTGNRGDNGAHENMPPFRVVQFIIKAN